MGALNLPERGIVYIDSLIVVHSVELHPKYASALLALWTAARQGTIQIITSDRGRTA